MTRLRSRRSPFAEPITKHLTWDVDLKPVYVNGHELSNYQSIVRNDNGLVLNIAKKSYHPATNEKFLEIVARIHEFTGFAVEGYSVFQEGRKILAFLKNTETMKIGDFDSNNYMVIGNSFDLSSGFFTGISNVVLRCANQFSRMRVDKTIRHNKQIIAKLDELVNFYKTFMAEKANMQRTFEAWHSIPISPEVVGKFIDVVLDINDREVSTIKKGQRDSLIASVSAETDAMGATAYGLFNGLTHYTTHILNSSRKTFGNALGHSHRLNERGFKYLNIIFPG